MKPEKLQDFALSNPEQQNLRGQVEALNQDLIEWKEKYKILQEKYQSKNKDDGKQQQDQKRMIDEAKKEMMLNHQMALEEEQKKIKNMD